MLIHQDDFSALQQCNSKEQYETVRRKYVSVNSSVLVSGVTRVLTGSVGQISGEMWRESRDPEPPCDWLQL